MRFLAGFKKQFQREIQRRFAAAVLPVDEEVLSGLVQVNLVGAVESSEVFEFNAGNSHSFLLSMIRIDSRLSKKKRFLRIG